jgi:hypothetical protein
MAKQFFKNVSIGTPVTIVKNDGTEPLSVARDAYESQLAAYTTWANGEWDKHNARMADTPEARRAAREKVKANKRAAEAAEQLAKKVAEAERKAARRGQYVAPTTEVRPAGAVDEATAPAAQGTGSTRYLDSTY